VPTSGNPHGILQTAADFVTTGARRHRPQIFQSSTPMVASPLSSVGGQAHPTGKLGTCRRSDVDRRYQYARRAHDQQLLGKNFLSSICVAPALLVGKDKKDLLALEVELSLDGSVKQKFALRDCVFSVEQIIAHWSILGIKPGDWLAIGASMTLQGDRLQNPVPLKIGSTIRCASPAIGELSHQVVAAGGIRR
jgi:hypothetical protein